MANWPSAVSTDANLYVAVNALQTTLSSSIDNVVTVIPLTSTTGFPTAGGVTIDSEVIFYTGVSGLNLTGATRGADGTTAASHNSGVPVGATIIAAHHNFLKNEVIAIEQNLSDRIGTGSTSLKLTAGTVSLPSLTTAGDLDTGGYWSGTDEFSITNNAIQTIRFTSDNRVGIGGAPDSGNLNEVLHVERTQNAGGAGAVDTVCYNPGTGSARVYPQTGGNATARAFYLNNAGTGEPGTYWSGGPNVANSIGLVEDRNGSYVQSPATWTFLSQSTDHYWRTSQSAFILHFTENTTERAIFNGGFWFIQDGLATNPSYAFLSDTASHHNGMYKIGTDHIGWATANTLRFDLTTALATLALPLEMSSNKITGLANATADTDAMAYGQRNDKQAAVFFTTTSTTSTTSSTFTDTALTATITPTSASSRIKITVTGNLEIDAAAKSAEATIKRGSTNLMGARGGCEVYNGAGAALAPVGLMYVDSPATTSATTYTVAIRSEDNTTNCKWGDSTLNTCILLEEIV